MVPQGASGGLNAHGRMSHLSTGMVSPKGSYQQQTHPQAPPHVATQAGNRLGAHTGMANRSMHNMSHTEASQLSYHDAMHQQYLENQHKAQAIYRQQLKMQKNGH